MKINAHDNDPRCDPHEERPPPGETLRYRSYMVHESWFEEFFSDREDARLRLKLSIVLALHRAVVKIIAFRCDIEQRSDECFTCNYTSNLVAPKPIIIVSIKCGTERSPFGIVSTQNIDYDFGEVNFSKSR